MKISGRHGGRWEVSRERLTDGAKVVWWCCTEAWWLLRSGVCTQAHVADIESGWVWLYAFMSEQTYWTIRIFKHIASTTHQPKQQLAPTWTHVGSPERLKESKVIALRRPVTSRDGADRAGHWKCPVLLSSDRTGNGLGGRKVMPGPCPCPM